MLLGTSWKKLFSGGSLHNLVLDHLKPGSQNNHKDKPEDPWAFDTWPTQYKEAGENAENKDSFKFYSCRHHQQSSFNCEPRDDGTELCTQVTEMFKKCTGEETKTTRKLTEVFIKHPNGYLEPLSRMEENDGNDFPDFGTEINPFDAFWKMFERLGRL